MRPAPVVLDLPSGQLLPSIAQVGEPMQVQTLVTKAAIEAFNERVIRWLAGSGELERDVVSVCPQIDKTPGKLAAVVTINPLGSATVSTP